MDSNTTQIDQFARVQKQNKQRMFQQIQQVRGAVDIQQYKQAFRNLYFEQGLFKNNKSKDLLEKTLQQLNPNLHFTEQASSILKNIAKIFLIELFEQSIQIREKTHKKQIDQEILETAYRKLKNQIILEKY